MGKHCQCSTPAGKLHTSFATGFDAALRVAQHLVMKYAQNALPQANVTGIAICTSIPMGKHTTWRGIPEATCKPLFHVQISGTTLFHVQMMGLPVLFIF